MRRFCNKIYLFMMLGTVTCLTSTSYAITSVNTTKTLSTPVETSLRVKYVSANVSRGVTSNRNTSIQPVAEFIVEKQATFGIWGNFPLNKEEGEIDQEVDLYLNYAIPFKFGSFLLGIAEYMFPKDDVDSIREIESTLGFDTLLNPKISAFFRIEGRGKDSEYYKATINQDLLTYQRMTVGVGSEVGYKQPAQGEEGFSHNMLTLTVGYDVLYASANWIFEMDEKVNSLNAPSQRNFFLAVGTGYLL